MLALLLGAAGVLLGAATQRTTGLGFALVAAPFLVLALGPRAGVTLSNLLAVVLCVVVLARTWRRLDGQRALLLAGPAVLAIPVGTLVVGALRPPVLLVLVGGMALGAMSLALVGGRVRLLKGPRGAVLSGVLSGLMNVTAGVGGPMVTAHAMAERWRPDRFVATAQVHLLVVNCASIVAKGPPALPAPVVVGAVVTVLAGAGLGERVARRVAQHTAHRLVVGVALLGGGITVLRGLITW